MSDTEQCQRCGDGEATSKFSIGANYAGSMKSTFKICEDCTRSLGEWYENTDTEQ